MNPEQGIQGVIAALVTPFDAHDRLDVPALEALVHRLIDRGVNGLMTTGGTGEFPHLSRDERRIVTEATVRTASGRIPIIAGTAACSLRETLHLTDDAAEAGADAAILVPPYYYVLSDAAIEKFFDDVAERASLPIVLYNNPLYTGNPMTADLMARLLERPDIVGVKQSDPNLGNLVELIHQVRTVRALDRSILTGIDSQFFAALSVGANGIFSTAACVVPETLIELYKAYHSSEFHTAKQLHDELQPLHRFLEYEAGYVAPAKEALRLLGHEVGEPRDPIPALTEAQIADLRLALHDLGALPLTGKPALHRRDKVS